KSCQHVSGPFSSVLVVGPSCSSPLGLCTHGILQGTLPGTYDFTFQSLAPSQSDPAAQFYSGTSNIALADSSVHLFGSDHGSLRFIGPGTAAFVTVVALAGGTPGWKHARGTIVASGVLDFATGNAVGSYDGEVCRRGD